MKNLISLIALLLCFTFAAAAQKNSKTPQNPPADSKNIIVKLEKDNDNAQLKGNIAVLKNLYADDFVGINARGGTSTKEQLISYYSAFKNSKTAIIEADQMLIRIFDKTAVVTARLKYRSGFDGASEPVDWLKYTRIYVFRDNRWQVIAEHFCMIKNPMDDDEKDNAE